MGALIERIALGPVFYQKKPRDEAIAPGTRVIKLYHNLPKSLQYVQFEWLSSIQNYQLYQVWDLVF